MKSMAEFRQDLLSIVQKAQKGAGLSEVMEGIREVLGRHPQEISTLSYSYRVQCPDTGLDYAFEIENGVSAVVDGEQETDVTVIGAEKELLRVVKRESNPAIALMTGRVKVKGKKAALLAFARFF